LRGQQRFEHRPSRVGELTLFSGHTTESIRSDSPSSLCKHALVPRPATFALLTICRGDDHGCCGSASNVAADHACLLGVPLPSRPQCKQGGDQVQRDSWPVAGVDAMFMGQCQQGCAVRERLNDHHASRYHDQHKADGKASRAARSALGCSLAHVGRLLQRSPRKACGSTGGGSRCQSR
jgi:hypothetical protein